MARQLGPRCACRPSHWPWPPALAQGCSCLPFLPGLGYHTSRPQRCDRLGAAERREQKTPLHSLSLEVSMAAARSKVGRLQPGFPRIALASCPACAAHRLTDHPSVRRQCLAFLRQPELSAPVGGRAPGLRSEGSWLAAELLRAGLEPGVLDRCAGWMGYCPSSPVPKVRPRPPAPHAPRLAHAHPPCPSPRAMGHPLPHCLTTDHFFVPRFVQVSIRALW